MIYRNKKKIYSLDTIKSNYIYNLIYQITNLLSPIILTPYLARTLGVVSIGDYSFVFSIVSIFVLLGNLGFNMYGQIYISKNRENKASLTNAFYGVFISRSISLVLVITLYLLFVYFSKVNKVLYLSFLIVFIANFFDLSWFFYGLEKIKMTNLIKLPIKILSISMIFIFVQNETDLINYLFIVQGTIIVSDLILWIILRKFIDLNFLSLFKSIFNKSSYLHIKKSLIYFLPIISSSIYTVMDKTLIGIIVNSSYENGYYYQAQKIVMMLSVFVTSLGTVAIPTIIFNSKDDKFNISEKVKSYLRFIFFISIPMSIGLYAISNDFILIFLGADFMNSASILKILSFLIIFIGIDNTIGYVCLVAKHKQKQFNIGVIAGAITNLTLNLLLIPLYKSVGAAIASIVAEIVVASFFTFYSRKYVNFKDLFVISRKYLISGIFMLLVLLGLDIYIYTSIYIEILIKIIVAVISYILMLLILRDNIVYEKLKKIFFK